MGVPKKSKNTKPHNSIILKNKNKIWTNMACLQTACLTTRAWLKQDNDPKHTRKSKADCLKGVAVAQWNSRPQPS